MTTSQVVHESLDFRQRAGVRRTSLASIMRKGASIWRSTP